MALQGERGRSQAPSARQGPSGGASDAGVAVGEEALEVRAGLLGARVGEQGEGDAGGFADAGVGGAEVAGEGGGAALTGEGFHRGGGGGGELGAGAGGFAIAGEDEGGERGDGGGVTGALDAVDGDALDAALG